jgi:hypothetical protein
MSAEWFVVWRDGEDFPGEPTKSNPSATLAHSPMSAARDWVHANGTQVGKVRIFVKGEYDSQPVSILAIIEMRPVLVSLEFEETA